MAKCPNSADWCNFKTKSKYRSYPRHSEFLYNLAFCQIGSASSASLTLVTTIRSSTDLALYAFQSLNDDSEYALE